MQVLNGLLSRDNQKEAISIPIGIIPAGSDNSLVWTVLGVRDPISAAIAIVKVMLSFLHIVYSCQIVNRKVPFANCETNRIGNRSDSVVVSKKHCEPFMYVDSKDILKNASF